MPARRRWQSCFVLQAQERPPDCPQLLPMPLLSEAPPPALPAWSPSSVLQSVLQILEVRERWAVEQWRQSFDSPVGMNCPWIRELFLRAFRSEERRVGKGVDLECR